MKGLTVAGLLCGFAGSVLLGLASYFRRIPGSGGDVQLFLGPDPRRQWFTWIGWALITLAFALQLIAVLVSDPAAGPPGPSPT